MKVQRDGRSFTVDVTADGERVVCHAGAALLAETADSVGLTEALSRGLACGGEPLAGALRPGNAGANTAADQIEVAEEALEQLPVGLATKAEIVLRADSAGATRDLLAWAREGGIGFSAST